MLYININSHRKRQNNEWGVENRYENFAEVTSGGLFSIGLHPWYITGSHWENDLVSLKKVSTSEDVVAIGECGLDKLCATDFSLQEKAFVAQIHLANQVQKPLIIHCVKAWDEVLATLIKQKVSVPVIFHGFSKSLELAQQITKQGYYLSFGRALEKERMQLLLKEIPLNQFFLETDDADTGIESIYNYAAAALSIDLNALDLQIQKNAEAVFGPSFIL